MIAFKYAGMHIHRRTLEEEGAHIKHAEKGEEAERKKYHRTVQRVGTTTIFLVRYFVRIPVIRKAPKHKGFHPVHVVYCDPQH